MISNRPMIPMLTHVDNLGDLNIDMTPQEQSLERIANDTTSINSSIDTIGFHIDRTDANVHIIQQEIVNAINPNVSEIKSTVGTTADADTATTVIGLLKSIVNKLS